MDRSEIDDIKERVDILELIGSDTRLPVAAKSYKGTRKGPCPWCGGTDRFHVHPDAGNWWCRQCGRRGGDAIAYWMQKHNCDFPTAVKTLRAAVGLAEPPARWVLHSVYQAAITAWAACDFDPGCWPITLYHDGRPVEFCDWDSLRLAVVE